MRSIWSRGRDKEQPGKFAYELYSSDGRLIERVGGFATHAEADRAGERAERRVSMPVEDLPEMTDDELLVALMA